MLPSQQVAHLLRTSLRGGALTLFARSSHGAAWAPRVAATEAFGSGGSGGQGANGGGFGGSGPRGGSSGDHFRRGMSWVGMLALGSLAMAGSAHAAVKKQESAELTIESVTNALWQVSGPILTNLGFSGCIGVACGLALKKVGQFLAVIIGLSFIALQGLAYQGFITVNWANVHKTVTAMLDLNKDGKVDEKDFKLMVGSGLGVLAQGVPSVAGFLAGFMLGVRM